MRCRAAARGRAVKPLVERGVTKRGRGGGRRPPEGAAYQVYARDVAVSPVVDVARNSTVEPDGARMDFA